MEECIFCNIVVGKIPSFKIYEDETYYAFLDIFPRVKGHALVIPKKHHRWVYDVPQFGEYWEVARTVAQRVQKTIGAAFVSFVTMGEEVPHAHIHILPQKGGTIEGIRFQQVMKMEKEAIETLATEIRTLS